MEKKKKLKYQKFRNYKKMIIFFLNKELYNEIVVVDSKEEEVKWYWYE
jgi:hypothetical protein